jgi:hypothetical protein
MTVGECDVFVKRVSGTVEIPYAILCWMGRELGLGWQSGGGRLFYCCWGDYYR